jgi:hypothetical protein
MLAVELATWVVHDGQPVMTVEQVGGGGMVGQIHSYARVELSDVWQAVRRGVRRV